MLRNLFGRNPDPKLERKLNKDIENFDLKKKLEYDAFFRKIIDKKNKEQIHDVIKIIKKMIKDKRVRARTKTRALMFLKNFLEFKEKLVVSYFSQKLVDRLYKLAKHRGNDQKLSERGETVLNHYTDFSKMSVEEKKQHKNDSTQFLILLLECWKRWDGYFSRDYPKIKKRSDELRIFFPKIEIYYENLEKDDGHEDFEEIKDDDDFNENEKLFEGKNVFHNKNDIFSKEEEDHNFNSFEDEEKVQYNEKSFHSNIKDKNENIFNSFKEVKNSDRFVSSEEDLKKYQNLIELSENLIKLLENLIISIEETEVDFESIDDVFQTVKEIDMNFKENEKKVLKMTKNDELKLEFLNHSNYIKQLHNYYIDMKKGTLTKKNFLRKFFVFKNNYNTEDDKNVNNLKYKTDPYVKTSEKNGKLGTLEENEEREHYSSKNAKSFDHKKNNNKILDSFDNQRDLNFEDFEEESRFENFDGNKKNEKNEEIKISKNFSKNESLNKRKRSTMEQNKFNDTDIDFENNSKPSEINEDFNFKMEKNKFNEKDNNFDFKPTDDFNFKNENNKSKENKNKKNLTNFEINSIKVIDEDFENHSIEKSENSTERFRTFGGIDRSTEKDKNKVIRFSKKNLSQKKSGNEKENDFNKFIFENFDIQKKKSEETNDLNFQMDFGNNPLKKNKDKENTNFDDVDDFDNFDNFDNLANKKNKKIIPGNSFDKFEEKDDSQNKSNLKNNQRYSGKFSSSLKKEKLERKGKMSKNEDEEENDNKEEEEDYEIEMENEDENQFKDKLNMKENKVSLHEQRIFFKTFKKASENNSLSNISKTDSNLKSFNTEHEKKYEQETRKMKHNMTIKDSVQNLNIDKDDFESLEYYNPNFEKSKENNIFTNKMTTPKNEIFNPKNLKNIDHLNFNHFANYKVQEIVNNKEYFQDRNSLKTSHISQKTEEMNYLQQQNKFYKDESKILYEKMIKLQKEVLEKKDNKNKPNLKNDNNENTTPTLIKEIKKKNSHLENYNNELQKKNKNLEIKKKLVLEKNKKEMELLAGLVSQLENYSKVLQNDLKEEKNKNNKNSVIVNNLESKIKLYDEKILGVHQKYKEVLEKINIIENVSNFEVTHTSLIVEQIKKTNFQNLTNDYKNNNFFSQELNINENKKKVVIKIKDEKVIQFQKNKREEKKIQNEKTILNNSLNLYQIFYKNLNSNKVNNLNNEEIYKKELEESKESIKNLIFDDNLIDYYTENNEDEDDDLDQILISIHESPKNLQFLKNSQNNKVNNQNNLNKFSNNQNRISDNRKEIQNILNKNLPKKINKNNEFDIKNYIDLSNFELYSHDLNLELLLKACSLFESSILFQNEITTIFCKTEKKKIAQNMEVILELKFTPEIPNCFIEVKIISDENFYIYPAEIKKRAFEEDIEIFVVYKNNTISVVDFPKIEINFEIANYNYAYSIPVPFSINKFSQSEQINEDLIIYFANNSQEFLNFEFQLSEIIEHLNVMEEIFPHIFFFNNSLYLYLIIGDHDGLIRIEILDQIHLKFYLYVKTPDLLILNYCKWFYWIFAHK